MNTQIRSVHGSMASSPLVGVAPTVVAWPGSTLPIGGTGSALDTSRADVWGAFVAARSSLHVGAGPADERLQRPDIRSAAEHLANIRRVFNPAIADLAAVFGVSRQAVYKWMGDESTPEPGNFGRLRALGRAALAFEAANVSRAPAMLRMKAFDGRSLLDLAAADELSSSHLDALIAEARVMDAAYDRSGLPTTRAPASDDWQAEVSIPGTPE